MEDWKMVLQTLDQVLDQRISPLLSQLQANSIQLRLLSEGLSQRFPTSKQPNTKLAHTQRRCTTALTTPRTSAVKALISPRASTGQTIRKQTTNPFPRPKTTLGAPRTKPIPLVIRGKRPSQQRPLTARGKLDQIPSFSEFNGTAFPDDVNSQDVSGVSPISHSSSSSLADLTSLVAQLS